MTHLFDIIDTAIYALPVAVTLVVFSSVAWHRFAH
jgi:hypothetical protein